MKLFRTVASYLWLLSATAVAGVTLVLLSPIDRGMRLRWPIARLWARGLITAMGVDSISIQHEARLSHAGGAIWMVNHTSGLDILVLLAMSPRPCHFLAKHTLFNFPFFGWGMRALGMIPVDRTNREKAIASLDRVAQRVQQGDCIVIFPEGTRSTDGVMLPFKKGGFVVAHQRGLPILPIGISGAAETLPTGFWVHGGGGIVLTVGELLTGHRAEPTERDALMSETRIAISELVIDSRHALQGSSARRQLEAGGSDVQ